MNKRERKISFVNSFEPKPVAASGTISIPGGTIPLDDPFYLVREADTTMKHLAPKTGVTLVIKASRQMGKSSLLLRYLSDCQSRNKQIAYIDFSIFSRSDLIDYPTFLSCLASELLEKLPLPKEEPEIKSQRKMISFMEKKILSILETPIVFAFDEVDRIMGKEYQTDFFTMLRLWHNNRVPYPETWGKADLTLVISTEPYLMIEEANTSPFNVGQTIQLKYFIKKDYQMLNQLHQNILNEEQIDQLWDLLQGQPYLTRLSFYHLESQEKLSFEELMAQAGQGEGIFEDHLKALMFKLSERNDLLDSFQKLISHKTQPIQEHFYRLSGAGLVKIEEKKARPSNQLYAQFFLQTLDKL